MSERGTPDLLLVTLTGTTVVFSAAVFIYVAIHLLRRLCSADGGRPSVHSRGLDALPVTAYAGGSQPPESCAICLGDYEEGEALRVLPRCKHCLHRDCLDMWLMRSSTCPICRTIVTELKIETTSAGGESDQIVSNSVYDCPPLTSVVITSAA